MNIGLAFVLIALYDADRSQLAFYVIGTIVYNLFISPLRRVPGP